MTRVDLAGKLEDARARVEAETPAEDRGLAKFARLTRKDTRVRADQDLALSALAKALMRRRTVKTERITENTLIRVAIDLLLAHAEHLRGSTEDELRRSVTAAAPKFRTSASPQSPTSAFPGAQENELSTPAMAVVPHSRSAGAQDVREHRPADAWLVLSEADKVVEIRR